MTKTAIPVNYLYNPLVLVTDQLSGIDGNSFVYTMRGMTRRSGNLCDVAIGVTHTWAEPKKDSYLIPVVFNMSFENTLDDVLNEQKEMNEFLRLCDTRLLVNSANSDKYRLLQTALAKDNKLIAREFSYSDFPTYTLQHLFTPKILKKIEKESKKFVK